MSKISLDPLDSQSALARFIVSIGQAALDDARAATTDQARDVAERALGGGARARALVGSLAYALAYADAELPKGSTILDEEDLATRAAHLMVLPLQTERLQSRINAVEAQAEGSLACAVQGCDGKAHSRGRSGRTFIGRHGKMRVSVRQSVCQKPGCGQMFSPACDRLGLGSGRFTPGCAEVVTLMATTVPHGKAVTLLGQTLQIEISEHAVQDLVEVRGETLLHLDQAAAEMHAPCDSKGLARSYGRPADAVPAKDAPEVAYMELDGVLPMTREVIPEQSVPVPGARGGKGLKYKHEGREVKNAVLYKASDQAQEMPSRGCLLERRYVSYLGHWLPFAALVWLTMLRLRFDQVKLLVLLSDGADWIRSLAKWLPLDNRVLLILDFFHAAHRIWEVARLIHGDDLCRQRARLWCEVVDQGHVDYVIKELSEMRDSRPNVQEKIDALTQYFNNNKDRMDYPAYRQRGLRITSGIVESANFHVTGARLKQQGMRWSEKGAREIALLRADLCNGLWSQRSRQLLAA
jgi:hypothetical protein